MENLPNGCCRTEITVYPEDWNLPGAFTDSDWYLQYRFTCPFFKSRYPRGKLCIVKKGINASGLLTERRKALKSALRSLKQKLDDGFNPITKVTTSSTQVDAGLSIPDALLNIPE